MVVHLQHLTPSVTMASMTVANLGRAFPLSWFHLISLQECTTASAKNPHKEVKTEWSTQLPLGKDQQRRHLSPTCTAHHLLFHEIQPSSCLLPSPKIRFIINEVMNICYIKLVKTVVTITVKFKSKQHKLINIHTCQ